MIWGTVNGFEFEPFRQWHRIQEEMQLFRSPRNGSENTFPQLNVWSSQDEVVITAEIPGMNENEIEISVHGEVLTIKGERKAEEGGEDRKFLRRERAQGNFERVVSLPFSIDNDQVSATYKLGILRIALPRAEEDKPRKIAINH